MFVLNIDNIKQKTISVNAKENEFLKANGIFPISKDGDKWIYIETAKILNMLKMFTKGGEIDNE